MSRRATVSAAQVEREYARAKALIRNISPLGRDPLTLAWFLGPYEIGKTAREAERFLAGVVEGYRYAPFATKASA